MNTPIHSINIDINSFSEAADLFNYASRRINPKITKELQKTANHDFWLHVRNQALDAMNTLKDLKA